MDGDHTGEFDRSENRSSDHLKAVHGSSDVIKHGPSRLLAIDVKEYPAAGVEVKEWLGLSLEHLEPVGDRVLVVVRTLLSVPAARSRFSSSS